MSSPFLLLQLTDPHIGARWGSDDPADAFSAVLDTIERLPDPPDAVIVTGDLVNDGTPEQYAEIRELLDAFDLPVHVLPGNHDDRAAMRRHFDLPGREAEPIQYAVDLGPLRLVVVDSTRPGQAPGQLDAERLDWLDRTLNQASDRPTVVAMHHPPLTMANPEWDSIGIPRAERDQLATVLGRHPQVRIIVAGHVHRTVVAELAGRPVLAVPSTYAQAELSFTDTRLRFVGAFPEFAVHAWHDGDLSSHVHPAGALRET